VDEFQFSKSVQLRGKQRQVLAQDYYDRFFDIGAMSFALRENGVYLHCASGEARTAFYVLLFAMHLTNCTFGEALHFMGIQYGCCHNEVESQYKIAEDDTRLTDLIR
jgi:hypothetical protein